MAADDEGQRPWVSLPERGLIARLDGRTLATDREVSVAGLVPGSLLLMGRDHMYAPVQNGGLIVVDLEQSRVLGAVPTCGRSPQVLGGDGAVYVLCAQEGRLVSLERSGRGDATAAGTP